MNVFEEAGRMAKLCEELKGFDEGLDGFKAMPTGRIDDLYISVWASGDGDPVAEMMIPKILQAELRAVIVRWCEQKLAEYRQRAQRAVDALTAQNAVTEKVVAPKAPAKTKKPSVAPKTSTEKKQEPTTGVAPKKEGKKVTTKTSVDVKPTHDSDSVVDIEAAKFWVVQQDYPDGKWSIQWKIKRPEGVKVLAGYTSNEKATAAMTAENEKLGKGKNEETDR